MVRGRFIVYLYSIYSPGLGLGSMLVDLSSVRTPQACARPSLVLDFLRASRKVSDDNVRSRLGQVDCAQTIAEIYQGWHERDSLLQFCKSVQSQLADTPDAPGSSPPLSWLVDHSRDHIEFPKTDTDPRVDAYSSRDETRHERVSQRSFDWIKAEEQTESIIRDSTLETIERRCFDIPPFK